MRTKTRAVTVAVAVAAVLLAGGCAKDDPVATSEPVTAVTALRSEPASGPDERTTAPDAEDADKDEGSGSYDEACSIIEEINDVRSTGFSEAIVLMGDARDASPDELADSWDTVIDAMDDLATVRRDDAAEEEAVISMLEDPDFLEATATIDDFAQEECGLAFGLVPGDEGEPDPSDERPGDDEIGVPSDGSVDPTSVAAVKEHLADDYGTEVWWPVLDDAAWYATGGIDPEWTITLSATSDWDTLTTEELVAACDAVAEHLDTVEDTDAGVDILDPDEVALVSRFFRDEPCAPEEGR